MSSILKMLRRLGQALCWGALLLSFPPGLVDAASVPLPAWINKAIVERRDSRSRDVIEESIYSGKRVFLLIRGDRIDTGDEHILFGEDGKKICQFGGFAGHVTSGSCDIEKIIYVRTIYPTKPQ